MIHVLPMKSCSKFAKDAQKTPIRSSNHDYFQYCCISVITAIELLYGAHNAPEKYREQELTKARLLIDYYTIVGIDDIPEFFSSEKYRLERIGTVIEDFDLLIGTTGVIGDLTVVTHNSKHFSRIEGIKLEDWTQ